MIFFKIVSHFTYRARGRFGNFLIMGSGETRYDFEIKILCTYYLQPFFSSNGKFFLKKFEKLQRYFGFCIGSVLFLHPVSRDGNQI